MLHKKTNILIRCDSSSTIGSGHTMRTLALAHTIQNAQIAFAVRNLKGNINHLITAQNYKCLPLNSMDCNELIALIKKHKIDTLIIDHYDIDLAYEKIISQATGVKIVVFDDNYNAHHCDVLINPNALATPDTYKHLVPNGCDLRCGADYAPMRQEFIQEKHRKTTKVFVAMGGIDHAGLMPQILKTLKSFKALKIHAVTLSANPNLDALQRFCDNNKRLKLHVDSPHIAKLMRKCDFGIITPSVIAHEARYMQLPFIAIQSAANQVDMSNYLRSKNIMVLDTYDEGLLKDYVDQLLNNLQVVHMV